MKSFSFQEAVATSGAAAAAAATSSSSESHTHALNQTGTIVGVVIGGIAGLATVGILFAICRRLQHTRRLREELAAREYEDKHPPPITPFPVTFPSELPETYPPQTPYYGSSEGQSIVMGSSAYGLSDTAEPQPCFPYHDECKSSTSTPTRASSSVQRTATLAFTTRTTSLGHHKTTLSDRSASARSLPIPPLPVSPSPAQTKAELRRAHQLELARQVKELEILTAAGGTSLPTTPQYDVATQERMRVMEAQIRELQRHQATPWAGQDDHELPPGYTLEPVAI
ncbi:hypothetical protein FB45DRAFT_26182 [Roridomyces roridus]|uniref:Uncharacterized protein n=1 Tax=Roridomyces roridus TaxID=1738132 RepID=A0AAD7G2U4_9AGAR|nr:hypothetical protein FB45DRAFT_26182 [Roridomyces roridus]